jgi:hypothetical protein
MVRLDPESFRCPAHPEVDLTPQVTEQMEDLGPPVAYDPRKLFGRRSRHTDFEVVVLCPGDGSDGSRHEQPVVGKVWP